MKQTKHILATIVMLLCSLTASAEAVQIDGIWYDLITKGKVAEVTEPSDGTKYSGVITIPATVTYNSKTYSVTSIGFAAFYKCSSLTSIVLPETLKSVELKAFAGCTELLDVYCYAESVPSTASNAFDGSYPENITLHVPSNALESYKTTYPWSSFGTIVALGASSIITIPSQPVLISTQGGTITLTGLADGTDVAVYTTAGTQLGTATAVSGTATITTSLTTGNTAIVKIGNSSIKVVVK